MKQINYCEGETAIPFRSGSDGAEDSDEKRSAHAELKDAVSAISTAVVETA